MGAKISLSPNGSVKESQATGSAVAKMAAISSEGHKRGGRPAVDSDCTMVSDRMTIHDTKASCSLPHYERVNHGACYWNELFRNFGIAGWLKSRHSPHYGVPLSVCISAEPSARNLIRLSGSQLEAESPRAESRKPNQCPTPLNPSPPTSDSAMSPKP